MSEPLRLGVVAVVPFWSQSDNMNVDSNYAYLRVVLPKMVEQAPHSLFLVFFPNPHTGRDKWYLTPDPALDHPQIKLIPWPYETAMRSSVMSFDVSRFIEIDHNYGPAVYWLHMVEAGTFMMGGADQSFNYSARPLMVAQHHYVIHKSLPYPFLSMFPRLWLQMGGSIAADSVIYNSKYSRRMGRESFEQFLSAHQLAELEAKSSTLRFGLVDGSEPVAPEATEEHQPVFLYNHRFEYYKHAHETFAAFDQLKQLGHKFEVWVTQAAGQSTAGKRQYNYDQNKFQPSRSEYLAACAVPAINTMNSVHETFCIAMLDSIMMGQLPVVPNRVTFPELVPPDYPFIFKNENEQLAMLDHILSTWPEEYNRWRLPLSQFARTEFNLDNYTRHYLDVMRTGEARLRDVEVKPHILDAYKLVFDSMELDTEYSPQKVRNRLAKVSPTGAGSQAFPVRRIIRDALTYRQDIHVAWNNGVKLIRRT